MKMLKIKHFKLIFSSSIARFVGISLLITILLEMFFYVVVVFYLTLLIATYND